MADRNPTLQPSPVEKEAAWPRRYLSRASSGEKSSSGEIEHFSISRESFDSYRRSFVRVRPCVPCHGRGGSLGPGARPAQFIALVFDGRIGPSLDVSQQLDTDVPLSQDICAKSPIVTTDAAPRGSLDSARFPRLPRSAVGERRFGQEPPTPEESFEDVGLNDDTNKHQPPHQSTKKWGLFSRFGSDTPDNSPATGGGSQTMSRFLRKRGQSGQGAELGSIPSLAMDPPPTAPSSLQEQEVQA